MPHPFGDFLEKHRQWGFSIILIRHRVKKPVIAWEQYRAHLPDNAKIGDWFGWEGRDKNIGLVSGKVSGNPQGT